MLDNYFEMDPKKLFSKHAKTFYFASFLFSQARLEKIALLYGVCRYIDDCADELSGEDSKKAMTKISKELSHPEQSSPFQQSCLTLESFGVKRTYLNQLVMGAMSDLEDKQNEELTHRDLMIYCYRVAGVVGAMMCPLLGVKDERAYAHAIDLGIAMQLTNICRDVLEDAQNGRIYLPREENETQELNLKTLGAQGSTPEDLKKRVEKTLELADQYYQSAFEGMKYIPLRPRLCILLAKELYQAIGHKIRKNHFEVLKGRTYLSKFEKILLTCKILFKTFKPNFWPPKGVPHHLDHIELKGLPGVKINFAKAGSK